MRVFTTRQGGRYAGLNSTEQPLHAFLFLIVDCLQSSFSGGTLMGSVGSNPREVVGSQIPLHEAECGPLFVRVHMFYPTLFIIKKYGSFHGRLRGGYGSLGEAVEASMEYFHEHVFWAL